MSFYRDVEFVLFVEMHCNSLNYNQSAHQDRKRQENLHIARTHKHVSDPQSVDYTVATAHHTVQSEVEVAVRKKEIGKMFRSEDTLIPVESIDAR